MLVLILVSLWFFEARRNLPGQPPRKEGFYEFAFGTLLLIATLAIPAFGTVLVIRYWRRK